MERVILHSDLNAFYASVEELYHPELAGQPIAVCGDPEARHGIVLAKNQLAKECGVKTGDVIWEARQKCRDIVILPAHYERYLYYSGEIKKLYLSVTNQVEPFGLDECWLDVTGSTHLFGTGEEIANQIREQVKSQYGLTVSVGVSYNKVFAKLGSDYKKPDATTVISRENYREIVWPLPVGELLYIGRATEAKLRRHNIRTIGELASLDPMALKAMFGKIGLMLWSFANGYDSAPVADSEAQAPIKSIGNSTTAPRDLVTDDDIVITLVALSESVAARLRKHGFAGSTIHVSVRDNDLYNVERQHTIQYHTNNSRLIADYAYQLYKRHHRSGKPVRSLGVRVSNLIPDTYPQLSLFPEQQHVDKLDKIERVKDKLRGKYGYGVIQQGIMLVDPLLNLDAMRDHVIHPVGFLRRV